MTGRPRRARPAWPALPGAGRPRRMWAIPPLLRIGLAAMLLVVIGAASGLLAIATRSQGAAKGKPGEDVFWQRADFTRLAPASIALLPAVSLDRNQDSERETNAAWAASASRGNYRWLSAGSARTILSASPAGDSLLAAARAELLKTGRVDSLVAPALCAKLRVQAVLGVDIVQWENQAIEPNSSGKPWSRVQLRAALVDSIGRLLWTGSGSETVEGPEYEPAGRQASGSESTAPHSDFNTGGGAAPPYRDVLMLLIARWSAAFPQPDTAAARHSP